MAYKSETVSSLQRKTEPLADRFCNETRSDVVWSKRVQQSDSLRRAAQLKNSKIIKGLVNRQDDTYVASVSYTKTKEGFEGKQSDFVVQDTGDSKVQ